MLGHHWYDSLSLHQLRKKKKKKKKKTLPKSDPLWQNFLDPGKMCKLVWAFTEIWLMMYMHDHWTELSFIRTPVGYIAREDTIYIFRGRRA